MNNLFFDVWHNPDNNALSVELTKEQSYLVRDALRDLVSDWEFDNEELGKAEEPKYLQIVKTLANSIDEAISFNYEY